ncbi:MAG: hypothetical protein V1744_02545 [Candidatus Altiarchaeota archaeon]
MRDKSHSDKVELWARYVREHPTGWRRQLNPFIDSQITKANRFYERLAETADGRKKLGKIRQLKAEAGR